MAARRGAPPAIVARPPRAAAGQRGTLSSGPTLDPPPDLPPPTPSPHMEGQPFAPPGDGAYPADGTFAPPPHSPGATATVLLVARARVGRVIGRAGETIKALQVYTGATIQIDQSSDPTRVVLAGPDGAVRLAAAMTGVRAERGGGVGRRARRARPAGAPASWARPRRPPIAPSRALLPP